MRREGRGRKGELRIDSNRENRNDFKKEETFMQTVELEKVGGMTKATSKTLTNSVFNSYYTQNSRCLKAQRKERWVLPRDKPGVSSE